MTHAKTPPGFSTVNPFIITRGSEALFRFLTEVFGGVERREARTYDRDGLLLHSELQIGGSTVVVAERRPEWPYFPSLLQVWVDDVDGTLARAAARGAEIVTQATPFFGDVFSRFLDPWGNLWWVYSTPGAQQGEEAAWSEAGGEEAWSEGGGGGWAPTPELTYIHETLMATLPRLRETEGP